MDDPVELVARYMHVAPPLIAQHYRPDCCIAATRITQEVFGRMWDRYVRPWPTTLLVANAAFVACMDRYNMTPTDKTMAQRWYTDHHAWAIGVGFPNPDPLPNRWPGHLVGVLTGPHPYLIDLSLGQCERPAKQIYLRPLAARLPEDPTEGTGEVTLEFQGCALCYRTPRLAPRPDFMSSPDWRADLVRAALVDQIIKGLRRLDARRSA